MSDILVTGEWIEKPSPESLRRAFRAVVETLTPEQQTAIEAYLYHFAGERARAAFAAGLPGARKRKAFIERDRKIFAAITAAKRPKPASIAKAADTTSDVVRSLMRRIRDCEPAQRAEKFPGITDAVIAFAHRTKTP